MSQSDPNTTVSARDEVLARGLIDWVPLQRLHYHVIQEHPDMPVSKVQQLVFDLVRSLIDEGLVELGDLNGPADKFVPWTSPLAESLERIRKVYVDRYDEDTIWPWYAWLNLTPKGEAAAERIESGHTG
jgi:hypothetical protein